ncbi:cation diffusion facilitator family transporter [Aphanothece hegewaldii]|nr:cation diffusion facilitator family transporter [Aphanothece hegewaldii]
MSVLSNDFKQSEPTQYLWLILGLRSSLFLIDLGIELISRSLSLLANSGHLFLDLVTLSLTLLAVWIVQHQTNLDYQKISAWVSLFNGVSLSAISFLMINHSIEHLRVSEPILGFPLLIGASFNLVINSVTLYFLYKDDLDDLNLKGIFLHGMADVLSAISVMLSALAVYFFQWFWVDAIAGLLVALIIFGSALVLIRSGCQVLQTKAV